MKPWLAEMLPAFFPKRMHTLGQLDVDLPRRRRAPTSSAYFHNPMPMDDGQGGTKIVELGGLYHHAMVRTPDGWRSRSACTRKSSGSVASDGPDSRAAGEASPRRWTRPVTAKVIKHMARAQVKVFRLTNGRIGIEWRIGAGWPQAGADAAARPRRPEVRQAPTTTPLLYLEDGADLVVVASQGGLPKNPQWDANLPRHPDTTVSLRGEQRRPVRARVADDAESATRSGRGWWRSTPTSRSTRSGPTG